VVGLGGRDALPLTPAPLAVRSCRCRVLLPHSDAAARGAYVTQREAVYCSCKRLSSACFVGSYRRRGPVLRHTCRLCALADAERPTLQVASEQSAGFTRLRRNPLMITLMYNARLDNFAVTLRSIGLFER
jgi:hypothetical protein